jgi:predicted esterase
MSNFSGKGPARVDMSRSLGPYGAYDMAGNVREWCWTSTGDRRYLLGGAWNEPAYLCDARDARSPFDRSRIDGFRCVKYLNSGLLPDALTRPVENHPTRDYTRERPVSDAVFRAYRGLYSYDRTPLNATVESVDNDAKYWRKARISYSAGYGNERIIAHLYLPRNVSPPYQTVIYFPHVGALLERSSEDPYLVYLDFIIRSGRALLFPVYKGTYERGFQSIPDGLNLWRDMIIDWSKDLGRSVDYLQTRNDLDGEKVAFYGFSMGSVFASPLLAMEKRLRAAVLLAGGFRDDPILPEVDPINFLPRVKIPVLMINGRNDFFFPVETYQRPMFKLLGTPEKDKRYILLDSGHLPSRAESIKEILNWLDRYLGPAEGGPRN